MVSLRFVRFLLPIAFIATFFIPFSFVEAQLPFGGPITFMYPKCQVPPATWLIVGPPVGGSFMYMSGASQSFPMGPPRHPGQFLLGMATGFIPCIILVPCPVGTCPIVIGGGMLIVFHGSSI